METIISADNVIDSLCEDVICYGRDDAKELLKELKHDYVRLLIDSKDSDSKKVVPTLDLLDILIAAFDR